MTEIAPKPIAKGQRVRRGKALLDWYRVFSFGFLGVINYGDDRQRSESSLWAAQKLRRVTPQNFDRQHVMGLG